MVPKGGLEPPRLTALPPQGSASTNSATWAGVPRTRNTGAKRRDCTASSVLLTALRGFVRLVGRGRRGIGRRRLFFRRGRRGGIARGGRGVGRGRNDRRRRGRRRRNHGHLGRGRSGGRGRRRGRFRHHAE